MADDEILHRIRTLMDEEHTLREDGERVDGVRLTRLEETLDQCWDLLRQRRAKREFGAPPSDAHVRDASTVEHYQQ